MKIEKFKSDVIPLRRKLFACSNNLLRNGDDAEDAVQETFLRLWKIREKLDGLENLEAFAVQIVKNICIDRIRTRKETLDIESVILEEKGVDPETNIESKDSYEIIHRIMKNLPELQRTIIKMRDIEDYELKEIAEITGTSVAAVTMNLSRARKKVRDMYLKIYSYKVSDIKNE